MRSIRFRARRAALLAGVLAGLPGALPASAAEVTLEYRAYVAGAPVGEATVDLRVDDGRYQVSGAARSNGWLKTFSDWRNRFSAIGVLEGAERQPVEFVYTERESGERRNVVVSGGTVQVTKNGRQRPSRPAPPYPDIISGLFVAPRCDVDQVLSTGRHVYRLTRLHHDAAGCRFVVTDDEDDSFEIDLVLGLRNDLVVPVRILVHAWISGWLELLPEA